MWYLPQDVLKKLLTTFKTAPERLTDSETAICKRICFCTLCEYIWVRRKQLNPARCPQCHKPGWDRPLIAEMMHGRQAGAQKGQVSE